jgi:hypothetical protein
MKSKMIGKSNQVCVWLPVAEQPIVINQQLRNHGVLVGVLPTSAPAKPGPAKPHQEDQSCQKQRVQHLTTRSGLEKGS